MKYQIVVILSLFLLFSGRTSAQAEQGFVADLVYQVQQLQEEVRQLRGQFEQQAYELKSLKERQRDQYLDLDDRLGELQSKLSHQPEAATEAGTGGVTAGAELVADKPPPAAPADVPAQAADNKAPVETPVDDKQAYKLAFTHLKELRYAEAAKSFYAFLETYPDSPLASNAEYWLGESYYVTRNYDLALESFQRLLEKYPDSKKVPDAWLKIGYTWYEMKDYARAEEILQRVKQQYPNSTLAKLAESRLKTMRLENVSKTR